MVQLLIGLHMADQVTSRSPWRPVVRQLRLAGSTSLDSGIVILTYPELGRLAARQKNYSDLSQLGGPASAFRRRAV